MVLDTEGEGEEMTVALAFIVVLSVCVALIVTLWDVLINEREEP